MFPLPAGTVEDRESEISILGSRSRLTLLLPAHLMWSPALATPVAKLPNVCSWSSKVTQAPPVLISFSPCLHRH